MAYSNMQNLLLAYRDKWVFWLGAGSDWKESWSF